MMVSISPSRRRMKLSPASRTRTRRCFSSRISSSPISSFLLGPFGFLFSAIISNPQQVFDACDYFPGSGPDRPVAVYQLKAVFLVHETELFLDQPLVTDETVEDIAGKTEIHTGFPVIKNGVLTKI